MSSCSFTVEMNTEIKGLFLFKGVFLIQSGMGNGATVANQGYARCSATLWLDEHSALNTRGPFTILTVATLEWGNL